MARSAILLRATRAAPPGKAGTDDQRRAVFGAGLQQAEELFEAAAAVGPFARPIPLFYAISQAGRAIAAAWSDEDRPASGHGLKQAPAQAGWQSGDVLRFEIKPENKPGVFGAVAAILRLPGLTANVPLGALWAALPAQSAPTTDQLVALPVWPELYMPGHVNLARFGANHRAYVHLGDQAPINDADAIRALLKKYPQAEDAELEVVQNLIQCQRTPWGDGVPVKWAEPDISPTPEGIPSREWLDSWVTNRVNRYIYDREHWLIPAVGDGQDELAPLLLWWALIFGLSILARYEPVAWRAALDPDRSVLAVPLERLLDEALEVAPALLCEAITHQHGLLPARIMQDAVGPGVRVAEFR
jgi:hypothetical protein